MEGTPTINSIILDQKLIHKGLLYQLLNEGGELSLDNNLGVKIIIQGAYTNLQIIGYSKKPKFTLQKYKTLKEQKQTFDDKLSKEKTKIKNQLSKSHNPRQQLELIKTSVLEVEEGGSIFDENL
tara:strand:+ start:2421 stop:2792 length:372 start_codon:yes stop_codon:yes gene_type:complete